MIKKKPPTEAEITLKVQNFVDDCAAGKIYNTSRKHLSLKKPKEILQAVRLRFVAYGIEFTKRIAEERLRALDVLL